MTGTADTEAAGVPHDLQARRRRRSRPTSTSSARTTQDLVYKTEREKFTARHRRDHRARTRRASPSSSARPASRRARAIARILEQEEDRARRPQRQAPRERGVRRRAGRSQGRHHRLDQHGRSRHRHHARRQRRDDRASSSSRSRTAIARGRARGVRGARQEVRSVVQDRGRRGRARWAVCTSSAPSATSRAASTTSCAAAPVARATRATSKFYLSLEDDLMRIFAGDRVKNLMERMGMPDDEPIEHPWVTKSVENAQQQGRGAQLRHPQEPARVRRRDERAAQDGLRAAPAAARSAATRPRRSTRTGKPTGEKREIAP